MKYNIFSDPSKKEVNNYSLNTPLNKSDNIKIKAMMTLNPQIKIKENYALNS
jgi:hypothetical protein